MDSYNLKTASGYINNLLLARGLLRDGKPIEFAHPSKAEGGKEATMAQIINVMHDLILRRDRDQDQREDLVQTLRTLRTESTQNTQKLERLQTRNEDLTRQVSLAHSQEKSAKLALRTAESSARGLREEMARLKVTVQQVRTSCANDIRKRDVQIQRLKSHLTVQQRGNKTGLVGASITITPGVTGMGSATRGKEEDHPPVEDPDYNLRQETTEFLTQLSQSLSEENDNLIGLVRSTLCTLRDLQGLPENLPMMEDTLPSGPQDDGMLQALPISYDALALDMDIVLESLRNLLTNPNFVSIEEVELREQQIVRLRMGWEKMELKWREAVVLMDGWRKRMISGGDTVNLEEIKRGIGLGVGLQTVNGANDISIISEEDEEEEDDAEMEDEDLEEMERELEEQESSLDELEEVAAISQPKPAINNTDLFNIKLPREQPALRETNANSKSPRKVNFAPPPPPSEPASGLYESNENTSEIDLVLNSDTKESSQLSPTRQKLERNRAISKPSESRIPRQVRTNTVDEPDSSTLGLSLNHLSMQPPKSPFSSFKSSTAPIFSSPASPCPSAHAQTDSNDLHSQQTTSTTAAAATTSTTTSKSRKRTSSPHPHPAERSPKLTVQDKLHQAEAEAAKVADGLKASKTTTTTSRGFAQPKKPASVPHPTQRSKHDSALSHGDTSIKTAAVPAPAPSTTASSSNARDDKLAKARARIVARKTKIAGKPRRRKSTLTPEELEGLMSMS